MWNALGIAALGVALASPATAYTVYVSNERGNSITVIDSETMEVVEEIPVGQRPRGINMSLDGAELYILACVLKRYEDEGRLSSDRTFVDLAAMNGLYRFQEALRGVVDNFPIPAARWAMRQWSHQMGVAMTMKGR